jgi:hypothetical protein
MFICSGGDDGDDEVSKYIIGAAIEVHRELGGPDLLETLYEEALCQELVSHGLNVQRQYAVEVEYKGRALKKRLVLPFAPLRYTSELIFCSSSTLSQ